MPLTDLLAGTPDSQFVARVKVAFLKACPAIQNESAGTANHASRLMLVGRILANPDSYANRFATLVALDATVFAQASLTAATDTQVENAVNAILDMLSLQNA